MEAFAKLLAAVIGWKPSAQRRLEAAQRRWREAGLEYQRARVRGDTRTIHAARQAFRAATHDVLRAELGR